MLLPEEGAFLPFSCCWTHCMYPSLPIVSPCAWHALCAATRPGGLALVEAAAAGARRSATITGTNRCIAALFPLMTHFKYRPTPAGPQAPHVKLL